MLYISRALKFQQVSHSSNRTCKLRQRLQNVPGITLGLRNTKHYNHLSYISFKTILLCSYTLLSTNLNVLETFLEVILWKPLQFFCHILNDVNSITNALSLQCWFQLREQVKISCSQVRRVWGGAALLSPWSLLRNPWTKLTGVLEHCHEGGTNCWFSIFQVFPSEHIPKMTMSLFISLFIVAISVNIPANSGNIVKLLCILYSQIVSGLNLFLHNNTAS